MGDEVVIDFTNDDPDRPILTGKEKLDAVVEKYELASGTMLRLVCGKSAIELQVGEQINLVGTGFNLFVEGDGHISTSGGKLNLNTANAAAGTSAPGPDHMSNIKAAVEAQFSPETGKKKGAVPAPAAKSAAPAAGKQAMSETKAATTPDDTDNFSKISAIILRHEGGYKNDPEDLGDPTNKGISWPTWTKYAKEDIGVEPTLDNLKKITTQQAEIIYKKRYWNPSGFNNIKDPKLALMSYDWTITSGGAGKKIQKLLNNEFGGNLSTDGVIGPKTIEAMNNVADSEVLTNRISEIRKDYYKLLVEKKPINKKYIDGWLNRVDDCLSKEIK